MRIQSTLFLLFALGSMSCHKGVSKDKKAKAKTSPLSIFNIKPSLAETSNDKVLSIGGTNSNSNNGKGNFFSEAIKKVKPASKKSGGLFSTKVESNKNKNGSNSFSEKSSGNQDDRKSGKAGRQGKRKKWFHFIKRKSGEERKIKKEGKRLFNKSNKKEQKLRMRKMKHPEKGLFPKGVIK